MRFSFRKTPQEVDKAIQKMFAEDRAPTAATKMTAYQTNRVPMTINWNADQATGYGYLLNAAVFRCVEIIAESLAACPFRAGKDINKPQSYDPKAPLAKLLGPPTRRP